VGGEVDLVCRDRQRPLVIFVEVKSRKTEEHGAPSSAVNRRKQRRLILAAQCWLSQLEVEGVTARFDVVEVLFQDGKWNIHHLMDAFIDEEHSEQGAGSFIPEARRGDGRPRCGYASEGRFHRRRGRG